MSASWYDRHRERSMHFTERTFKDAFGATVIQSRLQPASGRQGFEKLLFPGIEVGLPGCSGPKAKVAARALRVRTQFAMHRRRYTSGFIGLASNATSGSWSNSNVRVQSCGSQR
jgi:hypothetical protein